MTFVKGFKTKKEAEAYAKKFGGNVCSNKQNKEEYKYGCQACGLDTTICKYIVSIREV